MSIDDISLPTGVKGLKKYADRKKSGKFNSKSIFTNTVKSTPVHVKASLKYNDLLKHFDLNNIEPIRDSSKIKWTYLKSNPYGIEALAFKGYDDPDKILDFIKEYIDHDKLFDGAMEKKIKMFYGALGWDLVDKESTIEKFF
tara:strand:- start:287 stop:712 length:426 start_codon:yes stop_codon:yes gene_type:complete